MQLFTWPKGISERKACWSPMNRCVCVREYVCVFVSPVVICAIVSSVALKKLMFIHTLHTKAFCENGLVTLFGMNAKVTNAE